MSNLEVTGASNADIGDTTHARKFHSSYSPGALSNACRVGFDTLTQIIEHVPAEGLPGTFGQVATKTQEYGAAGPPYGLGGCAGILHIVGTILRTAELDHHHRVVSNEQIKRDHVTFWPFFVQS